MLHPDYHDMLAALCAQQAEFLIVGAYAMAAHGLVRSTGDIDIWIRPTADNAERVWRALETFRAPFFDLTVADLQTPGVVFQIGIAPVRIDLLTAISGVEDFEAAYAAAVVVQVGELEFRALSRGHLLRNKLAAARPKDLGDVAWLQAMEDEPSLANE